MFKHLGFASLCTVGVVAAGARWSVQDQAPRDADPVVAWEWLARKDIAKLERFHSGSSPRIAGELAGAPLQFEQNRGQWDPRALFLARGSGYQVFLTSSEAVLVVGAARDSRIPPRAEAATERPVVRLRLDGAKPDSVRGARAGTTRVHYFRGRDPGGWHREVPTFERVEYDDVYPGVDLVFYGNGLHLEYDFIVSPGADPSIIALTFEGADDVAVAGGDLVLAVAGGSVILRAPTIYQEVDGVKHPVEGAWSLRGSERAGFALGSYDPRVAVVIDPVVEFSSYLGGSGAEDALDNMGVALDASGHIYIAGTTDSADFPTTGDVQDQFAAITDAFVIKIEPETSTIVYATYLGGDGLDSGQALAIDEDGNAYVGGFTASTDFPTVQALQEAPGGSFDGFVAKLDADGSALVYSTYIGGTARDFVLGIDVDDIGQVYLTGDVESEDFPVISPLQPRWGGVWDSWAAKLTAAGDALVFSTFLGGSLLDAGLDIKVDDDGFVYVTGFTISSDFPTANAFQGASAGDVDAYVLKLTPDGSSLVYSTYLGGAMTDRAIGLDVDAFGNAYVVGDTFSEDFPAMNPIVEFGGFADAYVAKLDSTGDVAYTTFIGGAVADHGMAIAVDASGNAHLTGMTFSDTFLLVQPIQHEIAGDLDAFVASVDASGTRVTFSSFLGGSGGDRGLAIAADAAGSIVVVGDTVSADFPTVDPVQSELDGLRDMFVVKLGQGMDIIQDSSIQIEQFVAGLVAPRAMTFIGLDELLVVENGGAVRHVREGVLQPEPLLELPVDGTVAGRPYGLALHPDFPTTALVYFYFTEVAEGSPDPLGHRLYRYTWTGDVLGSPELLLDIPVGPASGSESGTIRFGIGGKLFLTSGDTGTGSVLQNVDGGAPPDDTSVIMRLNDDGSAPSDNPWFALGGNLAKYYAYGIRSSSALAIDHVNGNVWAADNGIASYDEVNLVPPGFNGGWSRVSGPESRSDGVSDLVVYPGSGYRDPAFSWLSPVTPGAMTFLDSDRVGDHYRDHLFVGGAIDGNLHRFMPSISRNGLSFLGPGMDDRVADDDIEASESLFGVGFGAISDLDVGPDGLLYVLSSARGSIFRLYWEAEIELKLDSSVQVVAPGGTVPVTLELRNATDVTQDFALLLSLMLPGGEEFPIVGPTPLSLPPEQVAMVTLPLVLPTEAPQGTWRFKGLIARTEVEEPAIIDRSEVPFLVIAELAR